MLTVNNLNAVINKHTILKDINLKIAPHALTAVIGKNGSGKSTLVSCIKSMTDYTGSITFENRDIRLMHPKEKAKLISVLPQHLPPVHITVRELAGMGRNPYLDFGKRFSEEDKKAVDSALEKLDITYLADKYTDKISGGERQKAYLAMILAQKTRLIVLDEPTAYMDILSEEKFKETLLSIKKDSHKTVTVVMHNLNAAVKFADRFILMDEGRVIFQGTKTQCLENKIIENNFNLRRFDAEDRIFFAK